MLGWYDFRRKKNVDRFYVNIITRHSKMSLQAQSWPDIVPYEATYASLHI